MCIRDRYQADWLLRFYGFKAEELLDEKRPFFNVMLDPKEDWAVRHLECFPVEINRAPVSYTHLADGLVYGVTVGCNDLSGSLLIGYEA